MPYVRKTEDVFEIEMRSVYGWEVATCESNKKDAILTLKDYRANMPEYEYRIRKRRMKKEM